MKGALELSPVSGIEAMTREELVELVDELRGLLLAMARTVEEIADERNAAQLLNELCHY
jgi:hypothetical protein